MSLSAPNSPLRQTTPSEKSQVLFSPSLLRIPHLLPDRARSLTPTRTAMSTPIRRRLPAYSTVEDAAELLKDSDNIVVLAGAGISTSVGIPDFRSAQGLYNQVKTKRNFQDPQQLFEADTFLTQPREFWQDVKPIIPKLATALTTGSSVINTVPKFGAVHAFLNLLQSKEKLLKVFTQNIDGLEIAAGVDDDSVVECHGTWDTATCITCRSTADANQYLPVVLAGKLPLCSCVKPPAVSGSTGTNSKPQRSVRVRRESLSGADVEYLDCQAAQTVLPSVKPVTKSSNKKRKRRDSDDESEGVDPPGRPGLLKPDITFFSEGISSDYSPARNKVKTNVDLLIIVGTSLPVEPVNLLPFEIPANVPQIWISNERCKRAGLAVDIQLVGDCNLVVEELCRLSGWTNGLLNRLWRNNLGSNMQAKEVIKARNQAAMAANTTVKEKAEKVEELPTREKPSPEKKSAGEKKEKKAVVRSRSKVKVEEVLGFDNMWMIKGVDG